MKYREMLASRLLPSPSFDTFLTAADPVNSYNTHTKRMTNCWTKIGNFCLWVIISSFRRAPISENFWVCPWNGLFVIRRIHVFTYTCLFGKYRRRKPNILREYSSCGSIVPVTAKILQPNIWIVLYISMHVFYFILIRWRTAKCGPGFGIVL